MIEVTNLNDRGPGTLRTAIEAEGPRIVVFRVGGTIELDSMLEVSNPFITIAGQTAPGGGITLKNRSSTRSPLRIVTNDVIVRYIRSRPGPNGGTSCDGIQILSGASNVIVDHVSVSWAVDENINTWSETSNITIQWSIISEGLHESNHPEGAHRMGVLLAGITVMVSRCIITSWHTITAAILVLQLKESLTLSTTSSTIPAVLLGGRRTSLILKASHRQSIMWPTTLRLA